MSLHSPVDRIRNRPWIGSASSGGTKQAHMPVFLIPASYNNRYLSSRVRRKRIKPWCRPWSETDRGSLVIKKPGTQESGIRMCILVLGMHHSTNGIVDKWRWPLVSCVLMSAFVQTPTCGPMSSLPNSSGGFCSFQSLIPATRKSSSNVPFQPFLSKIRCHSSTDIGGKDNDLCLR